MPFDKTDLLRQTSYETGDVLTLSVFRIGNPSSESTTSTSFTSSAGVFNAFFAVDNVVPADVTLQTGVSTQIDSETGETGTIKIAAKGGSPVLSELELTGQFNAGFSGFSEFSPSDRTSVKDVRAFLKTTDPTNGSLFFAPAVYFGVEL